MLQQSQKRNFEKISKKIDPGIKFANLQQNEVGPPILGQLLDLISQAKINISELRFKSYDPWDMAN